MTNFIFKKSYLMTNVLKYQFTFEKPNEGKHIFFNKKGKRNKKFNGHIIRKYRGTRILIK